MTTKRGGRPYKNAKIADGFNQSKAGITKKDIAQAKRVAAAERKLGAQAKSAVPAKPKPSTPKGTYQPDNVLPPVITGYDEEGWPIFAETEEPAPAGAAGTSEPKHPPPGSEDEDDEATAHQMLADMRWVYKQVQGRSKLKTLMAGDKEFMGMVKELMKAEISIITNKMKGKDGGGRQGFFVILKGLEEEKPIVKALQENKVIDIRQIERAINPAEYQPDQDDSEQVHEISPAEIVKKAESVESVENW
jgi:hypothetical protein